MDRRAGLVLAGLTGLLLALSGLWLFQGLGTGNRGFILELRAVKLGGLVTVAASVSVATVLFQTVSANRVLTPSIMGFDALYVLLQTLLVAGLGVAGFAALPTGTKFAAEVALMTLLACLLFGLLLGRGARDIPRTILTGVILGVMFRAMSEFVARILDPNEFAVVQGASFASFSRVDAALLPFAAALTLAGIAVALALAARLDVLALGRDPAVSLGLRFDGMVIGVLALVAVLVSVSTALVGPVTFFGLIVAGMAHGVMRSARHAALLPAAALIAANILVGGQLLFERAMGQAATLSVVVEFAGGLFFLYLLLKGRIR
ncbi:iron chelate uptake ABC transporter family permease subunit [Paracoccus siganidrum]|uniref:Enterobactin ABC transporter permease n=1 Tax=Paracoccus siganidrum TaxID=1276757 RepID=A0A419A3N8_9RHOB|nr:iron chelate uptake ABC transporter family permease subunit [Paracoccus siganidrum]RJL08211.1 enterobactin ABC transporter permease [Paracoccus siganidrum]RMC34645.1 enterobactin ABC transporter permease [Paracoccus siganidrum]